MTIGLIGKKCGMTRIFSDDGKSIPVTVIAALPNLVVQIKTAEKDGYRAVQVTTGEKKASKVSKALAGHFAKANVVAGEGLWEFCLEKEENTDLEVGKEIKVDFFAVGQEVDVSGMTKGKGFAGVIKRHHFSGGYASHGCSLSHRSPGSIGQQSQKIVKIDNERNLIMIRGGVPGAPGSRVVVIPAVKVKRGKKHGD